MYTYNGFGIQILNLLWEITCMQSSMSNMTLNYSHPFNIILMYQIIRNMDNILYNNLKCILLKLKI
jgi:hypothetical protein